MYGLVNKALKEMIASRHGAAVWEQIKQKAEVEVDVFVATEGYPDDMTYRLVGAASEHLGIAAEKILNDFGVHWVVKTAVEGYGHLMTAGGKDLREFLINLPNFHNRVKLILPHLEPPQFRCTDIEDHSLRLHYYSHREGLAPFVTGLIKGLGEMFKTPVSSSHVVSRGRDGDHDVFYISWDEQS